MVQDSVATRRRSFFRPVQQGLTLFVMAMSVLVLGAALYSARWIVFALLIGLGFGVIITPLIDWLHERARFPKALSVLTVLVGLLAVISVFLYFTVHLITEQVAQIQDKVPLFLHSARARLDQLGQSVPWLKQSLQSPHGGAGLSGGLSTLFAAFTSVGSVIGGLFFILATGFYLAVRPQDYLDGVLTAFPAYSRPKTKEVLLKCGNVLRKWFYSQLLAMLIVGVLAAIGLSIIGSNYWLVLALITSALELIPFLGPVVSFFTAALITLASQPDQIFWVMGFYFLLLRLEGDLIIPLVMKGRIELPPIQLLTLMLVMGEWFGVMGLLAATPVLAVARTIYLMTYVPRMNQRVQSVAAEPPPPAPAKAA